MFDVHCMDCKAVTGSSELSGSTTICNGCFETRYGYSPQQTIHKGEVQPHPWNTEDWLRVNLGLMTADEARANAARVAQQEGA